MIHGSGTRPVLLQLGDPLAEAEWQALLKPAGVRPARLHDARHTAATMLLVLKVPTSAVMDVMGWSQVSMTSRYQHVPAELLGDIAASAGGLLRRRDRGSDSSPPQ
jgi:integrase